MVWIGTITTKKLEAILQVWLILGLYKDFHIDPHVII